MSSNIKVTKIPELGRLMDPEESSIAPLLLRVIPMQPPIAIITYIKSFHCFLKMFHFGKQSRSFSTHHPHYTRTNRQMTKNMT